jgi:superfamily II DNA or RNA helicase
MPQDKNKAGWQPSSGIKLRNGQQQVIDLLQDPSSMPRKASRLIAELPTGYGKTFVICAAFALLRDAGVAGRALIIVPSSEQFESYLNEVEADMAEIGAPISGALQANSLLALKAHRQNSAEIFVTTVQALSNGGGAMVNDLLSTGRWLVAADEFHRYAKSNTWGDAVGGLNSVFTLAVSATPDRTDKAETAIMGSPDVRVTLREAVDEGAIRPVTVCASDYRVDLTMQGMESPQRFTTSELTAALAASGHDISSVEVKRDLRYFSKYLHKALLDAWGMLDSLNAEQPGEHKMLVFAMGVKHAKSICEQMNMIAGDNIANWIGVQSTVQCDDGTLKSIGRPEAENKQILDDFKANKFNVLVQVKKATEGFNDVRCSVLLFLNMTAESVQLKQMIGRGLRRNYRVEPDTGGRAKQDRCFIYVSKDHPGLEYMIRLEGDLADPDDEEGVDGGGGGGGGGTPVYPISDFYILDAGFVGEELFYPFGDGTISETEAMTKARQGVPQLADASDADIRAHLSKLFGMDPKPVSTAKRIQEARQKIHAAAKTLASNVVRLRAERSGGTFIQSLLGDTIKAIHSRWLYMHPDLAHDNMTLDELEQKHAWIQQINAGIKDASDRYTQIVEAAPWLIL